MKSKLSAATFLALSTLATRPALAQAPETTPASKWQFYFEAGPKITQFRSFAFSGNTDSEPSLRDTFSGFADVKAFKPLSEHLVLSGTVGLDMQLLNYRTGYTESYPAPGIISYKREHISRLLTRARVDWGLHYQFNLGKSGHLLPGISVGQMINLSRNGYSYTFIQPGLYFTTDRLLLSLTASDTPYNVQIPGASNFVSTYRGNTVVNESEYRVRELQVSVGARF